MQAAIGVVMFLLMVGGLAGTITAAIWVYSQLNAPLWVWLCWGYGSMVSIVSLLVGQLAAAFKK